MLNKLALGAALTAASVGAQADFVRSTPMSAPAHLSTNAQFNRPGMDRRPAKTVHRANLRRTERARTAAPFVGVEAVYVNQLPAGSGASPLSSSPGNAMSAYAVCPSGCISSSFSVSPDSALAFSFRSPVGTALNGRNGVTEPDFGVWLADPDTNYLYSSDGGAGGDSDLNDMMVGATMDPLPEPHTWALLAAGLGIFAIITRRRSRRPASPTK